MATRKTYTLDFKLDAVKLVTERGLSHARVARDLGIGTQTLRNWRRTLADVGTAPAAGSDAQQLAALRRENELLREEREILKKALGTFSRVPRSQTSSASCGTTRENTRWRACAEHSASPEAATIRGGSVRRQRAQAVTASCSRRSGTPTPQAAARMGRHASTPSCTRGVRAARANVSPA